MQTNPIKTWLATLTRCGCAHNRHDELANSHTDSPDEKDRSPTPFIGEEEAGNSGENINHVRSESNEKRSVDSRILEELRPEIEGEVDSRELRASHDDTSGQQASSLPACVLKMPT